MLEGKFYEDLIQSVGTYEVEKLACNHKHEDGKIDIDPLINGKVRCNLCGKEFRIIDGDRVAIEQAIQNACDSVNDIVQTIKLIGDEKENKELCQFEFTLHKLLGLYVKAKHDYDSRVKKYNNDNIFKSGTEAFGNPMNSFGTTKEEK